MHICNEILRCSERYPLVDYEKTQNQRAHVTLLMHKRKNENREQMRLRREARSAAELYQAGRRESWKLQNRPKNIPSAEARFGDELLRTEPEAGAILNPAPPPRHDPSGNTDSSLARAAGNGAAGKAEDSGLRVRGNPPGAHRALQTARDLLLPMLLLKAASSMSPSPAQRSAEVPEFSIRTSLLLLYYYLL